MIVVQTMAVYDPNDGVPKDKCQSRLHEILITAFTEEAEYIKNKRAEAIERLGDKWVYKK